jgi:tetratricopeptide (TPR) repeat protein
MALTAEEYFQSGIEKYKQGLFEEALADWTEAIALEPNYAAAYFNRGNAKWDLSGKNWPL